ncbi:MAG: RluA family pseudouridine synthase [Anaerolineales bacterium]|nr:RluA family pseudouridine synthase [Anaerolineales bacterium]
MDQILTEHLEATSRSRIQQLIKQGLAEIDGKEVTKTGYRLEGGETVKLMVPDPAPVDLLPEDIPLDILYEDSNLLVINKQAGLVVHPSVGHESGTLVHAVLFHVPDLEGIGGEKRPGIVHRIDRFTSGILLIAKNDAALIDLQRQFKERLVSKQYAALVDGHPPTPEGRIEMPVGRDPSHRKRMSVTTPSRGKMAVTVYRTAEVFENHTLLDIELETGRTHQIRVHLAYIGIPIAGDTVYGYKQRTVPLKQRFFLHASSLSFTLPGEEKITTFNAPLPSGLENVLIWLREREKH